MMNKLLVFVFTLLCITVNGQSTIFEFTPGDSLHAKFDKNLDEYIAKGFIKNISNSTIKMVWKRTYLFADESCNSLVCDNINCYQPWVSFAPKVVELKSKDSSNIDLHFEPGCCEPGPTSLTMDFYLLGDTSNSLLQVHYACGVVTQINYLEVPQFSIQPNPAAENLTVKLPEFATLTEPVVCEVLTIEGKIVKSQAVGATVSVIPVQDLSNGMYFLRLRGKSGAGTVQKFVVAHGDL